MIPQITNRHQQAINRIGNIMLPKNGEFPSFEETGVVKFTYKIIENAYEQDAQDLLMLLNILSYMPTFVLKFLVKKMENSINMTGGLSTIYRQLNFGLKGLVYTLYYSEWVEQTYTGKAPIRIVDYKIKRIEL